MNRPTILLNFAISADGKIGSKQKGPSKFTSSADLDRLLTIRKRADAILVGRGTLEADEMTMTIPPNYAPTKQPLRCIISQSGHFDPAHRIFQSEGGPIHLITTEADSPLPRDRYEDLGARLHLLSLPAFLTLAKDELGVSTLLCEGGGSLAKALFALDFVDEINLTVAGHSLIGGREAPTITGLPGDFLPSSRHFRISHFEPTPDSELFVTWQRIRARSED